MLALLRFLYSIISTRVIPIFSSIVPYNDASTQVKARPALNLQVGRKRERRSTLKGQTNL
jgi:hypothetical protein